MRRKGWSDTKIARAMGDKRKSYAKPDKPGPDSLELWHAVLHDLRSELNLPYAGLLVRAYRGDIETEEFPASRRDVAAGVPWQESLATLDHDEVVIFRE